MQAGMSTEPDPSENLLNAARSGDQQAWQQLLELHTRRVRRMVDLRMDPRLKSRIDSLDVIQEAFVEAWQRLDEYLRTRPMPFFLWLRFLTGQRLVSLHRHHFGTQKRTPAREVRWQSIGPGATSVSLARRLFADGTSPSLAASREEDVDQLRTALEALDETERELIALRHFEHLSNVEAAAVLDLNESTASTNYLRALRKLKGILENVPGFLDDG